MIIPDNVTSGSKFIDIMAIDSDPDQSICCNFCLSNVSATHLIYRLNRDDSYALNYACSDCAKGWREIADLKNDRVV